MLKSPRKKAAALFTLSSLTLRISVIANSLVLTYILSRTDFGAYSSLYISTQTAALLISLGLPVTATKFIAQNAIANPQKAAAIERLIQSCYLYIGALFFPALLIASTNFSKYIYKIENIALDATFSACTVCAGIYAIQNGILSGRQRFTEISKGQLILAIGTITCAPIGAYFHGILGACVGLSLPYLLVTILQHHRIKKNIVHTENPKISKKEKISIFRDFTLPAFLATLFTLPVLWLCQLIIINSNNGLHHIGITSVALQWHNALMFLPGIIASITLPKMSSQNSEQRKRTVYVSIACNLGATSVAAAVPYLFWDVIQNAYKNILSPEDKITFLLITCAAVINSTSSLIGNAISAAGKMWAGYILNINWAICIITITFALLHYSTIPGSLALSIAFSLAYAVHFTVQTISARIMKVI